MRTRLLLYGCFLALVVLVLNIPIRQPPAVFVAFDGAALVAHAGGGLPQGTYSNARQAFDGASGRGFDYVEADLSWTSDGRLVLIHDWDLRHAQWFGALPWPLAVLWNRLAGRPTHAAFMRAAMRHGLDQMDLEGLLDWMRGHPRIRLITDMKENPIPALAIIAGQAGDLRSRMIAQVYAPEQIGQARALGFEHVIWTLYAAAQLPDDAVVEAAVGAGLFCIAMPAARAPTLAPLLAARGECVAVHTVNGPEEARALTAIGTRMIYTDYLHPGR